MRHCKPKTALAAVCAAIVAAGVLLSSIALAAPRPSGVAPAPSAPTVAVQDDAKDAASGGALFTRADMPRPSGSYDLWLKVDELEPKASQAAAQPAKPSGASSAIAALAAGTAPGAAEEADEAWWSIDMDCTPCHATEDLVAATAECTALTDNNGTVVNPHDLPAVADHEGLACSSCHKKHDIGTGIDKTAQRSCVSCHHAYVYDCFTCHA